MKRLVLRISALGVVVVLGLIAIAQAQRGNDKESTANDLPLADNGAATDGGQNPLVTPPGPGVNPLRVPGRRPTPLNQPPAMGMAGEGDSSSPVTAEKPPSGPSIDPFGLRNSRGGTSSPAGAREVGRMSDDIPDASPPPIVADRPASDRYGDRYTASRRGSDRDSTGAQEGSDATEPAPLKADPFASPAKPVRPIGAGAADSGVPAAGGPRSLAPPGTAAPHRIAPPDAEGAESVPAGEGLGRPGGQHLEGPQAPQLTVQKFAPAEIQVGKPATFKVTVRNTGTVPASAVEVHDQVPKGTRVIGTTPKASRGVQGELVFVLGTLKSGEETSVEVQLMPLAEGEIGSVATVTFNADASARCVATKPQLVVETTAPERVLIGDEVTLTVTISNPGTGVATGVVLEERIPEGLQHPAGNDLEYEVGELRPGESRKLELTMVAKQPGPVTNVLTARGDGNLRVENKRTLEVAAPRLEMTVEGPKKRYLEREATYQLSVTNPGTAPAEQIELVAYLPTGLKFVSANNGGQYEEANRAVHWRLEELPVKEIGTVELVAMPVEAGQQNIKLLGTANRGLRVEKEQPVVVEGIAAVMFQVADTVDPIEVGGETTYEVRVVNQGSKAATNVRVAVALPAEMKPVAAEGPTRYTTEGGRVLFDGLARLAPKADTTYRVRIQALKAGDLRTSIQLMTDEMSSPVTKEESTRVYADE
jgi:uncharacterized repeat protein (TIGR01451 family)